MQETLEWEDVFPFLYLMAAFEGIEENRSVKHLAIDEMQDYTPIQFAVLNERANPPAMLGRIV